MPLTKTRYPLWLKAYVAKLQGELKLAHWTINFGKTYCSDVAMAEISISPAQHTATITLSNEWRKWNPSVMRSTIAHELMHCHVNPITDPAPHTTFTHLDATTVLSRPISELGIYPAVDPLDSTSRILDPRYIGENHFRVANRVKQILQRYKDLQDIIAILGIDELSEEDRILVGRARRIQRFLSQNTFVAKVFTGIDGSFVPLSETIAAFDAPANGDYDHIPEQAFFMCGGLDDVERKAAELAKS